MSRLRDALDDAREHFQGSRPPLQEERAEGELQPEDVGVVRRPHPVPLLHGLVHHLLRHEAQVVRLLVLSGCLECLPMQRNANHL